MTHNGLHLARPAEEPGRAGDVDDRPPVLGFGEGARPAPSIRATLLEQLDALYRFILVRVGFDEAAAEDLLQQTAETALRSGDRGVESAEGWLRGIAKNLVRRHWRECRCAPAPLDREVGARTLALLDSPCPHRALEDDETRSALLWAIASLPAEEQRLLYAVYRRARTHAEVAAELGCSAKAVEMKLYRARARLRESLAATGDEA